MRTKESTTVDGNRIIAVRNFDWPQPHTRVETLTKQPMETLTTDKAYDCAADGECFSITTENGDSCIASVEDALREAGYSNVYVIWSQQNRSPKALKRWQDKWSKRTAKG